MPCGTGKSLTAFWIAKELKGCLLLVVVPSLDLIKRFVEDWTREVVALKERPLPEWLCVCSDESAGVIDRDEFVSGVYDLGLDVTTEPEQIKSFLSKPTKARRIVFVTYQSSPLLAKVAKKAGIQFDVAILDEAHKTAGARSKSFATLLFDKNLSISRRIFMTATERVTRGSHDEIVSMDQQTDYGKVFYHLSFKDAIHSSPTIITDYKVLTVLVSDEETRRIIRDRRLITDNRFGIEDKDARELAVGIALQKAFSEYEIKHAISFHRSINSAEEFRSQQSALVDAKILSPPFDALHISSRNSAGERAVLLQEFAAAERALLTNARCLTEGVDVPAIDCVLFADPKHSTIDIVQASGRALRPYPGKKFGYIMVPLVVPEGMSFEEFSETTNFRQVGRVIASFSTQDERIAEEFRVVDRAKKPRDRIINIVSTASVGLNFDLEKLAESISTKIWERIGPLNWRPFEEARRYARGLKLTSLEKWKSHCNSGLLPSDIPRVASHIYAESGWLSWGDFLGSGNVSMRDHEFRSFEVARKYARRLGLKNAIEWAAFCKEGEKPDDIPATPSSTYRNKGWINWGDWLGTGTVSLRGREYRSFEAARTFAQTLRLKNRDEWSRYCKSGKKPNDIPVAPWQIYEGQGWISMGDWLGTGSIATHLREYRSFLDARKFIHAQELKNVGEWRKFTKSGKLPIDISANPDKTYKNDGWKGFGDWLGTGTIAPHLRRYRRFEDARIFVQARKLKNRDQWRAFIKSGNLPEDIPANPNQAYRDEGWVNLGDWLGTGTVASQNRNYLDFKDARSFAQKLKLRSVKEWVEFCKSESKPDDIPGSPQNTYKDKGWVNWGDWLGTGSIAPGTRVYRSFKEARRFARSLKLSTTREWLQFCESGNRPVEIPTNPNQYYRDAGWAGMGDWLGTGTIAPHLRTYRSFENARSFARKLKLKNQDAWRAFCKSGKLPSDIPANPGQVYADVGWLGMGDWLGTGNTAPRDLTYRPFEEARRFARSLKLINVAQWLDYCRSGKKPSDIPTSPDKSYKKKGWCGMGDWLGTGTIASQNRVFRTFEDARDFARSQNLKSVNEWRTFCKSGNKPEDIPAYPNETYRDKGWVSWGDWLGS